MIQIAHVNRLVETRILYSHSGHPILVYLRSLHGHPIQSDIHNIEMVQHHAERFVSNDFSCTKYNYLPNFNYTPLEY